ncbi:hypothetical protein [Shewanella aestuarii]|uniref:Uncharacterized protein n=1 Tax=Shewanella aestuarii TaxID=1028752 RepID=A0A6G9QR44_9GAMM|nr:hypothetical protein [Shewanella aestuarii]QIR16573.1 hypothetical protein HBH39_19045 [Shewanella aestuarii]
MPAINLDELTKKAVAASNEMRDGAKRFGDQLQGVMAKIAMRARQEYPQCINDYFDWVIGEVGTVDRAIFCAAHYFNKMPDEVIDAIQQMGIEPNQLNKEVFLAKWAYRTTVLEKATSINMNSHRTLIYANNDNDNSGRIRIHLQLGKKERFEVEVLLDGQGNGSYISIKSDAQSSPLLLLNKKKLQTQVMLEKSDLHCAVPLESLLYLSNDESISTFTELGELSFYKNNSLQLTFFVNLLEAYKNDGTLDDEAQTKVCRLARQLSQVQVEAITQLINVSTELRDNAALFKAVNTFFSYKHPKDSHNPLVKSIDCVLLDRAASKQAESEVEFLTFLSAVNSQLNVPIEEGLFTVTQRVIKHNKSEMDELQQSLQLSDNIAQALEKLSIPVDDIELNKNNDQATTIINAI